MPVIGPIKRRELIAYLRALGFEPPVSGGEHQYMRGRGRRLQILRQGGIDREEWEPSEVALPGCEVPRSCGLKPVLSGNVMPIPTLPGMKKKWPPMNADKRR